MGDEPRSLVSPASLFPCSRDRLKTTPAKRKEQLSGRTWEPSDDASKPVGHELWKLHRLHVLIDITCRKVSILDPALQDLPAERVPLDLSQHATCNL